MDRCNMEPVDRLFEGFPRMQKLLRRETFATTSEDGKSEVQARLPLHSSQERVRDTVEVEETQENIR